MTATTRIPAAAATPAHVRSRRMLIGAALGIVYVVWGSTYLAIRIMVGEMPPLVGAGLRFLTAGLLVAAVLVARGGPRRMVVTGRELAGCALIAVLLPVLGQGLVTVGENGGAPSGITALLIAAVPLWVICYRILSGERPARRTLAGVFLGFGGVAVLITANGAGGAFPPWTMAVVVLAGLSWAFGSWYQPRLQLPGNPFVVAVYEMLVGGGVLTVLGPASGEGFHPAGLSGTLVGGVGLPGRVRLGRRILRLRVAATVGGRLAGRHLRIRQPAGGRTPGLADPRRTCDDADHRRRSGRGRRGCHRRELRTPSPGNHRFRNPRRRIR